MFLRTKPQAAPVAYLPSVVPGTEATPPEVKKTPVPPQDLPRRDDPKSVLEVVEPMAKSFLTAVRVEDILPLIDHRSVSEPRLKQRWPSGRVVPQGLSSFAEDGNVNLTDSQAVILAVTSDFKPRPMYFVRVAGSWKIDWEAWTGWSEMPWGDFTARKPVESARFRVMATESNYYNFGFTDEKKWRVIRLESPDEQYHLYGYLERGSELDHALDFTDKPRGLQLILDLSFPPGAAADQVLVRKVVSTGWVDPDTKGKP
ncbi:hypothetical protein llg_30580 [Luteolibacter sp. LG18]|nr:hypothetical protein llg_30580 [Luteolibacter sp. LG18]